MEFTGIIAAAMPTREGTYISLDTSVTVLEEATKLMNKPVTVVIKPYREKRSLDANGYAWKLISEIAEIHKTSKEEIYELMLRDYGTNFTHDDGGIVFVNCDHGKQMSLPGLHFAYVESYFEDGAEKDKYRLIKGSSQYDTKEMSQFIDGIVSEAQDLKIQTATPDELRMMKERWNV
jgi:hypothetical protein